MIGFKDQNPSPSVSFMVFSACFYGICSAMMNIVNKFLLNSWQFNYPELILASQLLFTIFGLKLLKSCNKISLVSYSLQSAKSCALLSSFFSSNTCLALFALTGMNLPMYSALRRCVPLPSAFLSYIVFAKKPPTMVQIAVILITAGAVTAASGDIDLDLKAYIMGCLSVVLMAAYLVTLQYTGIRDKMSSTDLLYVNSCNCVPLLLLLSLRSFRSIQNYASLTNPGFLCCFLMVIASGSLLNFSTFLCTNVNSALTTTCVGVLKSAFVTVAGMFLFGGVVVTSNLLIGLVINFFGGLLYAYAKYRQTREKI